MRRWDRVVGAAAVCLLMAAGGSVAVAEPPAGASGIDLVGPPDAWPPERWTAIDKASGNVAAKVSSKWGFVPLPPGTYALAILPRGHEAVEVGWGDVVVEDGKATRVELTTGVEVVGRDEQDDVLEHWDVIDQATGKKAAHAWHRWGFTPLPPGSYAVRIRPRGHESVEIPWATDVRVEPGKATRVAVDTGVEVVARDGDAVLEHWEAIDKATGKTLAHAWQRWGFTPLLPGAYALRILPRGHLAVGIGWGDFTVESGRTTTVALRSGVEVSPRADGEEPLEHWDVVARAGGKTVAHVWQRWGFAHLPPGAYSLRIRPEGPDALDVAWGDVDLAEGQAVSVRIDSGIYLVGRTGQHPPEHWHVHDAKSRVPVARVYRRFGFTPLPPGTYDVVRVPRRWQGVEVGAGQVVSLAEPDVAARWALVSGAGKKTEKERDPAGWKKLEEEVERAIRRAAAWLKTQSDIERMDPKESEGRPTIGILALAHAGELERDPALARRARDYLMRRALNDNYGTYITSLVSMALTDMGATRNRARIFDCATWLVENQGWGDDPRRVWGYGDEIPGFDAKPPEEAGRRGRREQRPKDVVRAGSAVKLRGGWDNSNAQFGVLGLHSAARARVGIPKESWERIESHFREMQDGDGGWGYGGRGGANGSMTCAGLASLVIARHHLAQPALDPAVLDGLEWLDWNFTVEENPKSGGSYHHYYLYGLERVGVLAGTEFLGEHEWYPTGARYLLRTQHGSGGWGNDVFVDTCYSILFLRRATLPLESELPALVSVTRDEKATRRDVPSLELILDCSGSMKEPVDGRPKMEVARTVIKEVLAALPAEMHVGLRLYGHKNPPQKTDTELVVPIGPLDEGRRRTIQRWIDHAQARGWTPMIHSLLQAKGDFAAATGKGSRTVVLVSDGQETGGGKIEDVAAAYRGTGIDVVIHVVGFDVQGIPLAQQQLREIARVGKGRYYAAANAKELSKALGEVMPSPGFEVLGAGGKVVARGRFDGEPVELKAGSYRVRLVGSADEALDLALEAGDEAAFRVDDAGKLVPEGS